MCGWPGVRGCDKSGQCLYCLLLLGTPHCSRTHSSIANNNNHHHRASSSKQQWQRRERERERKEECCLPLNLATIIALLWCLLGGWAVSSLCSTQEQKSSASKLRKGTIASFRVWNSVSHTCLCVSVCVCVDYMKPCRVLHPPQHDFQGRGWIPFALLKGRELYHVILGEHRTCFTKKGNSYIHVYIEVNGNEEG